MSENSHQENCPEETQGKKRGRIPMFNPNEDAKGRRLELNRKSAQESRKRKKQYMSNMEERI